MLEKEKRTMIPSKTASTRGEAFFATWQHQQGARSEGEIHAYLDQYLHWMSNTYGFQTPEEHHAHAPQVISAFLRDRVGRYPAPHGPHAFAKDDPGLIAAIARNDIQDALMQRDVIRAYHMQGGWDEEDALDLGEDVDLVTVMRIGLSFNKTHDPARSRRTGYPEQRLVFFAYEMHLESRSGVLRYWERERRPQPDARALTALDARSRALQDVLAAQSSDAIIAHAADGRTVVALSEQTARVLAGSDAMIEGAIYRRDDADGKTIWGRNLSALVFDALPGSRVTVPAGRHRAALMPPSGVEVMGDGPADSVVIETDPTIANNSDDSAVLLLSEKVRGVRMRNLTFHGHARRIPSVLIGAPDAIIEDCVITGSNESMGGLVLFAGASCRSIMRHCVIQDAPANGLCVANRAAPTLEDCEITRSRAGNASVYGGAAPLLRRVRMTDGFDGGYIAQNGSAGLLDTCLIAGNAVDGVYIEGPDTNPEFINVSILNNGRNGVSVTGLCAPRLRYSRIAGNTCCGVQISHDANPFFASCRLYDGQCAAVTVAENGRGEFTNCVLERHANDSVVLATGGAPTFTSCRIRNGAHFGVAAHEAGEAVFDHCSIRGHLQANVHLIDSSGPVFFACLIADGHDAGVVTHAMSSARIRGSRIVRNARAGVGIDSMSIAMIDTSVIAENGGGGMVALGMSGGVIRDTEIVRNRGAQVWLGEPSTTKWTGGSITASATSIAVYDVDGDPARFATVAVDGPLVAEPPPWLEEPAYCTHDTCEGPALDARRGR